MSEYVQDILCSLSAECFVRHNVQSVYRVYVWYALFSQSTECMSETLCSVILKSVCLRRCSNSLKSVCLRHTVQSVYRIYVWDILFSQSTECISETLCSDSLQIVYLRHSVQSVHKMYVWDTVQSVYGLYMRHSVQSVHKMYVWDTVQSVHRVHIWATLFCRLTKCDCLHLGITSFVLFLHVPSLSFVGPNILNIFLVTVSNFLSIDPFSTHVSLTYVITSLIIKQYNFNLALFNTNLLLNIF